MSVRATILDTADPWMVGAEIAIDAPVSKVFELVANPEMHSRFDGSGTVKGSLRGPKRLYLGAKFGMSMRIKIPYHITNEVVAFEEDRLIVWRHLMHWQWRYEFTRVDDKSCIVREYFDGKPSRSRRWLKITGSLQYNPTSIAKTLVRLKALAEAH